MAQSEADVVDGVRLALETGQKVAFHGSGIMLWQACAGHDEESWKENL